MLIVAAAAVAAGDVTDNTQSVRDVMTSLLLWCYVNAAAHMHRQTDIEWTHYLRRSLGGDDQSFI